MSHMCWCNRSVGGSRGLRFYPCTCMDAVQEADLAAAPLIATSARQKIVDFTHPFMISRIVALMKKRHATQFGIHSVRDLARQSTIKFGTLDSGLVPNYFRVSRHPDYQRMWAEMVAAADVNFVPTTEEGIQRVLASTDERPWAFITISATFSYSMQICNIAVVHSDAWLPYGLALPVNSPYTDRLSLAIMELNERDYLEELSRKWFQPENCSFAANDACSQMISLSTSVNSMFIINTMLHFTKYW